MKKQTMILSVCALVLAIGVVATARKKQETSGAEPEPKETVAETVPEETEVEPVTEPSYSAIPAATVVKDIQNGYLNGGDPEALGKELAKLLSKNDQGNALPWYFGDIPVAWKFLTNDTFTKGETRVVFLAEDASGTPLVWATAKYNGITGVFSGLRYGKTFAADVTPDVYEGDIPNSGGDTIQSIIDELESLPGTEVPLPSDADESAASDLEDARQAWREEQWENAYLPGTGPLASSEETNSTESLEGGESHESAAN